MTKTIAWLVFVGWGCTLPAGAATYKYLLQFGSETGLAAFSVSWQSSSLLNPPPCTSGIDLSKQTDFLVSGSPQAGYSPLTTGGLWTFCSSGGTPIMRVFFSNGTVEIGYYLGFSATSPPFTTGVFSPSDETASATTDIFFGPFPGPPVTLTISEPISFPPVPGWLASIIRASLTVAGPVTPPAGAPVEAMIGFVDVNGNSLGQPTTVPLVPGQVSSVELNTANLITAIGQHMEIVPVVSAVQGTTLPPLQLTAEVLNSATGFGGVLTSVNGLAPPPPPLAPQGLAGGQIMQLTASAFPVDPCTATLSFANSQGVAIGGTLTVNLSPGQSSQPLDLNSQSLNLGAGQSMVVQPIVVLQTPIGTSVQPSPVCLVTSDVFDQATGITATFQIANFQ